MLGDPNNPFADLVPPASDPGFSGYIPGTPKPKKDEEPPSGYRWTNGPGSALIPIPGGPADKPPKEEKDPLGVGAKARADAIEAYRSAQAIRRQVREMQSAFLAGPGSTSGLEGLADLVPTETMSRFDAAGNSVRGQVGNALGFTGGQLNSVAEAKMAVGPYIPKSSDYDQVAKDKIARLWNIANDAEQRAITVLGGIPDDNGNITPVQGGYSAPPYPDFPSAAPSDRQETPPAAPAPGGGPPSDLPPGGRDPSPEEQAEFFRLLKSEGRAAADDYLSRTTGRISVPSQDLSKGYSEKLQLSPADQFAARFNDDFGGIVKGAAALPDMLARGAGALMAFPADLLGYDDVADKLRHPVQIGDLVDEKVPTSGLPGAELNRFAGELVGGALGFPAKAAQAGAERVVAALGERSLKPLATPGAGRLPGALAPYTPALSEAGAVAKAGQEEGVRVVKPMLPGKAGRRAVIKLGKLEADPNSRTGAIIQQGLDDVAGDIEAGVSRLGGGGQAQAPEVMGERLRSAAQKIEDANRLGHEAVYNAARAKQPGATVDLASARARIDAELARLNIRPSQNRETIRELQRYRADLDKPLPLDEVRKMRTEAWSNMQPGNMGRSSAKKAADKFMKNVIDGANADIKAALTPEAQAAWDVADKTFRGNKQLYETAIKPIFGDDLSKLTGEQIFGKIRYASQKDARALRGLHSRLDVDTSRDLAATIAEGMGRAGEGDAFSPMRFVKSSAKMSPSARETFFGPSGARSIENLQLLSRRLEVAGRQINRSRTARPVATAIKSAAINLVSTLLGGGVAYGAGAPAGVGAGLAMKAGAEAYKSVATTLSAKALMTPRVSRWLSDAAKVSTKTEAREMQRRLGVIMDRETAIASELAPVYERINSWLNQPAVAPLAAQPAAEGQDDER